MLLLEAKNTYANFLLRKMIKMKIVRQMIKIMLVLVMRLGRVRMILVI